MNIGLKASRRVMGIATSVLLMPKKKHLCVQFAVLKLDTHLELVIVVVRVILINNRK